MKEVNHAVFRKGLFTSLKGQLFFTKGHSNYPQGFNFKFFKHLFFQTGQF